MFCLLPCTGPRTVPVCPCPSPKGWYRADQEAGASSSFFSLGAFCRDSLTFWGCRAKGGALCLCCVSETLRLSGYILVLGHVSDNLCARALHSENCCRSSVSSRGCCVRSALCSSPRTEWACTCPSPKGWCRAGCGGNMGTCRRIVGFRGCCALRVVTLSAFCRNSMSFLGCGVAVEALCLCCVSESVCLSGKILSGLDSVYFCACALRSGFCCRSSISCQGSCACSVPCSSPRTERACACPSPEGWYRAGCGRSMCSCCRIVRLCEYCTLCIVARVIGGSCLGGLCLPRMWMMCGVFVFASFRSAVPIASCRLSACLRV